MTTTIRKSPIGVEDLALWTGASTGETFTRETSTGFDITIHRIGALVDVLACYGGNVNYDRDAIANANSALGTSYAGLELKPGTWNIASNLTVNQYGVLYIPPGATIKPANGITVTINSKVMAGAYQIFDQSAGGTVTVSTYPQDQAWWGSAERLDVTGLTVAGSSVSAVSDTAYAASWNGVTTIAPSKNAVYDEMEQKVTAATPPAIGETSANTIRGLNKEILVPDSASLTAIQCSGTIINNYGMADANAVIDLPAAAAGLSFMVVLGAARAKYYRLKCLDAANDKIYLNGVAGADDGYVQIAAAVVGAAISFFTFQTGSGAYDWFAIPISGLWVAG